MTKTTRKDSLETGATLIEMLAVMAVLASISIGLYTGISSVMTKVKSTKAHVQVTRLVKSMHNQFVSFPPASVTAQQLSDIGVFEPGDLSEDKSHGVHVYGGPMKIEMGAEADGSPYFTLSYENLSTNVCSNLMIAEWGSDPSSGLRSITVKGSNSYVFNWDRDAAKPGTATGPFLLAPEAVDATMACSTAATEVGNASITWAYYL